jgi:hypothetical protein
VDLKFVSLYFIEFDREIEKLELLMQIVSQNDEKQYIK